MTDFKTRLQQERDTLATNLDKLKAFLDTGQANNLSDRAKALLVRQQYAQQDLLYILDQRLQLLDVEAEQAAAAERALQAATPVE